MSLSVNNKNLPRENGGGGGDGIEIACRPSVCLSVRLSVCNVGGSGSHRLEILETNCTVN